MLVALKDFYSIFKIATRKEVPKKFKLLTNVPTAKNAKIPKILDQCFPQQKKIESVVIRNRLLIILKATNFVKRQRTGKNYKDKADIVVAMFLDFSRAFRLDKDILMSKLIGCYRIKEWQKIGSEIESYLDHRNQQVKINKIISDEAIRIK